MNQINFVCWSLFLSKRIYISWICKLKKIFFVDFRTIMLFHCISLNFGATYLYFGATYYDNNLLHLDPMVWKMLVPPTIWGHNRLKIAALDAEENIIKVLYKMQFFLKYWNALTNVLDNLCCWQFWRRWAHSMRWVGGNRIQGGPSVPAHRIQYKPPRPQQRCKKQFESHRCWPI